MLEALRFTKAEGFSFLIYFNFKQFLLSSLFFLQFAPNLRIHINNWNIFTIRWLRYVCYEREIKCRWVGVCVNKRYRLAICILSGNYIFNLCSSIVMWNWGHTYKLPFDLNVSIYSRIFALYAINSLWHGLEFGLYVTAFITGIMTLAERKVGKNVML